jgi:hypothetical protein
MQCAEHPDRIAIDTCSVCGNGICDHCRIIVKGKKLCPNCLKKRNDLIRYTLTDNMSTPDIPRRISKKTTTVISIIMTVLYIGTLCSYLLSWHGSALSFSAVVFLFISLIFQLVLLWRNSAKAQGGILVGTLMNLVLIISYTVQYHNPSGLAGVGCIICFVPIIIYLSFNHLVSNETLGFIMLITIMIMYMIFMLSVILTSHQL